MKSAESNKVSSEDVLEYARAWKDKGATLLLSISRQPDKRAYFCDKLWVSVYNVTDQALAFSWQLRVVDPIDPSLLFAEADGKFVVRLEGASFSMLDIPKKTITISRGPYRCDLTEVRASEFE